MSEDDPARLLPGRHDWRPIHLFECGDFVILHKLLPSTSIVDIMRFNDNERRFAR